MLSEAQRELLAARLRKGRPAAPAGIGRRAPGGDIPLSFGQEQLWFIDQFAPGLAVYNIASGLRLHGNLELAALGRAVNAFVARHEALRTRLVSGAEGRPVQLIDPPAAVAMPLVDLTGPGGAEQRARLRELAGAEAAQPFELATGPLLRTRLVRLAGDEHVLLVVVHHSVFDGWSFGIMMREIPALYQAEVTGEPAGLPELAVQFADYAVWERQRLQGPVLEEMVSFWRDELAGVPTLQLPTDRPRPLLESHRGGVTQLSLELELLAGLRALSSSEGCTLFVTLLAALQALLARFSGQDDIVIGTPSANRSRAELAPLVGFLVNTLPIRTDLSGDPTFLQLLHRVRETTVSAYAHQDIPFAKLVEALQIERDASRTPIFQLSFAHAETAPDTVYAAGIAADIFEDYPDPDTAKFDLALFAGTNDNDFTVVLQYALDLFDAATAERLLAHFGVLLAGVVADPSRRLSELPLLTDDQLYQELVGFNDTAMALAQGCIHERFEDQAARTPQASAAVLDGESISYAELNAQANQLGRRLIELGVGPDVLVGISMQPSIRRLAVVLAILKAGGGYVPLDPALPADRLAFMVADAAMPVLVSDDGTGLAPTVLGLDAEWAAISLRDKANLGVEVSPATVAYVIYTSGSTGQPKGVQVEHRQVLNFVAAMVEAGLVTATDRMLQFASLNFDVSVLDMFTSLLVGGCAVLAPRETLLSPPRLGELMRAERVSFCCLPPAVLNLLADQDFPELNVLISAGEELPTELAKAWLRPGLRLINGYGPTETTVLSLFGEVDGASWPPPVGRPLPNYQAYVLDAQRNPVPIGVVGELYTGGHSVARGYLNRPELTAQRFLADEFADRPDARLYRTGDLVKRLPDGRIVFLGRLDGQVKIRGLRVELGEIETVLAGHPAVLQVVVVVTEDRSGDKQLTGYLRLAAAAGTEPTTAELKQYLAQWLPGYMVPARLMVLEQFPLNSSGKIDKRALPDPNLAEGEAPAGAYLAPVTLTETTLTELYAALLNLDRVGADDSFFDIGGNSLHAMQLISRIRSGLGVDLAVTAVFLAPTPQRLAARIEAEQLRLASAGGSDGAGAGPIVALSDGIGQQPLFLVHAVGGTVFAYTPLAIELADSYQVYGIQSASLAGDPAAPDGSIAELAASYLAAIRQLQPAGPYRLGGWSMGGLLAHQIACQLEAQGERVACLILLDAPFAMPVDASSDAQLAEQFVADALRTLGRPAGQPPVGATPADQLDWLADTLDAGAGNQAGTRQEIARRFAVFTGHRRMMSGYRPDGPELAGTLAAEVLLIGAEHSPNAAAQPEWPAIVGTNLHASTFDADHYTLLQPPLAREVAAIIAKGPGSRPEPDHDHDDEEPVDAAT